VKSLDELLPRSSAASGAKGLSFLSLIVFGLSAYLEHIPFIVTLVAWFASCLFICHWIAASYAKLTLAQSRSIDYVYLGIATLGVFVLATNYEVDRYEYRQNRYVEEERIRLKQSRVELDTALVEHQQTLCHVDIVAAMSEQCEQAKKLIQDYNAEDRAKDDGDGSRAINLYMIGARAQKEADDTKKPLYRIVENSVLTLRLAHLHVVNDLLSIELQTPLPRKGESHPAWQIFTWPFILAFALALRLTRTTIEVFNWAQSAPPPIDVVTVTPPAPVTVPPPAPSVKPPSTPG
jgi:hypothetical protein